jgi:hypothetical protein
MISKIRLALVVAAILPCVSGCVVVSMHSTRPVEVHVTDRTTHEPVVGADISIVYSYDSYGVFRVLRMPDGASARTDLQGVAVMPMATFGYGITFRIAGSYYEVTPALIRHGGYPSGEWYTRDSKTGQVLSTNFPPMVVELIPKK